MCPAPRKTTNRGLERGLHTHPTKGYRWRHPTTGKYHYFGKSCTRAQANETARALNLKFIPKTTIFDRIVGANNSASLHSVIQVHKTEVLSKRRLAKKTLSTYTDYLSAIDKKVGDWNVETTTPHDVAQFLKIACTGDRARQLYRQQLIELFNTAIEEGLRDDNPASSTRRPIAIRKRGRLTYEAFCAIRVHASTWLQNAMDLALTTIQRREDLVSLKWEADLGHVLRVEQLKTGKRLQIEISPELREILQRCRDNVASPYILHRLPEKSRPRHLRAETRVHHTQILPEQLTRAFESARDASAFFAHSQSPPSFHEIRSLGIALYRDAGWPKERVQRLAGHEHLEMTQHYLDGHEIPWETVPSGGQIQQ
jgi:integrase